MGISEIKRQTHKNTDQVPTIILLPYDLLNTFRVCVAVPVGSALDKIPGTAHMLEHVLHKSALGAPLPGAIFTNAATSFHWTSYSIDSQQESLDAALTLISNLFLTPRLDPLEFRREQNVVVQEMQQMADRHLNIEYELISADPLLKGTGYDCPIIGTLDDLSNITEEVVSEYHRQHYSIEKSVVLIAGPIQFRYSRKTLLRHFEVGNILQLDPTNITSLKKHACAFTDHPMQSKDIVSSTNFIRHEISGGTRAKMQRMLFRYVYTRDGYRHELLALTSLLGVYLAARAEGGLAAKLVSEGIPPQCFHISCNLSPQSVLVVSVMIQLKDDSRNGTIETVIERFFNNLARRVLDHEIFNLIKNRTMRQLKAVDYCSHDGLNFLANNITQHGIAAALMHLPAINDLSLDSFNRFIRAFDLPDRHGVVVVK